MFLVVVAFRKPPAQFRTSWCRSRLSDVELARGEDVAGLLAGVGAFDYTYVAELDALAVGAEGQDLRQLPMGGNTDAEALLGPDRCRLPACRVWA